MRLKFLAGGLIALFAYLALAPAAMAETRTLKLYFIHTRERAEITYKRNGRYVQDGLNQINRFLRDWRRNESTKMDPRLLDVLWEVYRATGARDYIHIVSAYRSPATNEMLRKRSRGVANKSQHMLGKAIDFYIPGVKLSDLRRVGLKLHAGGVGYYPKSGSPFVHLDVGNVRHWPRMSRSELLALFPDGKTLHVPSDGKPLPGYQQALAAYSKRQKDGGAPVIASASSASSSGGKRGGGFLAALFGGGRDQEEDEAESRATPAPGRTATPPAAVAAPAPEPEVKPAEPETPAVILASLPDSSIPVPHFAPRPEGAPAVAEEPAEEEVALAYAVPVPVPRPAFGLEAPQAGDEIAALLDDAAVEAVMTKAQTAAPDAIAALLRSKSDAGLEEAQLILANDVSDDATLPAELAYVPVPRPDAGIKVASLPATDPLTRSNRDRVKAGPTRTAALALKEDVRTTAKAPKPSAGDVRPDPKPMVIPLPQKLGSHALDRSRIAEKKVSAHVPSFRFTQDHLAPREVYTLGFSRDASEPDAERFSGNAVVFLSVARFR